MKKNFIGCGSGIRESPTIGVRQFIQEFMWSVAADNFKELKLGAPLACFGLSNFKKRAQQYATYGLDDEAFAEQGETKDFRLRR